MNKRQVRTSFGALAQLGERLICIQEVRSSILLGSTKSSVSYSNQISKQFTNCLLIRLDDFDIVKRDTINNIVDPCK